MPFHHRRLPHFNQPGEPVFLTWRLHGSLPEARPFPSDDLTSGQAFAIMDRLLDTAGVGPFYLRQPAVAEIVVKAIRFTEDRGWFETHAYVVMPNHVHLLITPAVDLWRITKSLKGYTARSANATLGTEGQPFWQDESYDRLVRDSQEFEKIRAYIEANPVKAGLAAEPWEYRWSSASQQQGPVEA